MFYVQFMHDIFIYFHTQNQMLAFTVRINLHVSLINDVVLKMRNIYNFYIPGFFRTSPYDTLLFSDDFNTLSH